jgi:regulatory protein
LQKPIKRRLDRAALWEYALRILGSKAYTVVEMRLKLGQRAEDSRDADEVLAQLREYGYLNDQRFAEGFATARLDNQRFGPKRVLQDLRQRRVAGPTAERTVQEVYENVDQTALIEEWIRRKYKAVPREGLFQEQKDLASAFRRLVRAGFRPGDIIKVLKRFAADPELLDNFEPPEEPLEEV